MNRKSSIYNIFEQEMIDLHPEIFKGKFTKKNFAKLHKLRELSLSLPKQIDFWTIYGERTFLWSNVDRDNLQHLKDLYDACILKLDQEFIAPLVYKLKKINLYDKTLVIIMSDHGEEFFEHVSSGHGGHLYDELIHIPLIIKLPKDISYKQNRIKDLTQSIDIMPTILDVLNISIPQQVQGISLKGLWETKEDALTNKYTYAYAPNSMIESIRSKDYKLIYHLQDNQHELYDLNKDPQEKTNIYNQRPEIAETLEADFHEWRKSLPSYVDQEHDFRPEIDETTRERIKKTGYW